MDRGPPPKTLNTVEVDLRSVSTMPDLVGVEGNSSIRFEGLSNLAAVSMDSNQLVLWFPPTLDRISDDEWDRLVAETLEEDRELLKRLAED